MRAAATSAALLALVSSAAAAEVQMPPASFRPTNNAVAYAVDQGGLGCLRIHSGTAFFVAAVPGEAGAAIEEVTATVEDANADALALFSLVRRRAHSFEVIAMSPPSRGGAAAETLRLRPETEVILEPDESILIQVLLTGTDVCFHGARVTLR